MDAHPPRAHVATMSRLTSLATGLVLAVASGCSDEPPLPPVVWEGEHLRFGTDADESTLCAGTLPYLDDVTGHLSEVFGRPNARVSYYWLPEGTGAYCPEGAEGCVSDRGTFSQHAIHQHELASKAWSHRCERSRPRAVMTSRSPRRPQCEPGCLTRSWKSEHADSVAPLATGRFAARAWA